MTADQVTQVDLGVRIELAHAALQFLADRAGVDLLHIKGIAFDERWRSRVSGGSDADVLVRPSHVGRFLAELEPAGWRRRSRFHTGSAFEHAQTYWHDHLGYADVHRFFPGISADDEAFDVLWADRQVRQLASYPCTAPNEAAQALIHALNDARNHPGTGARDSLRQLRDWPGTPEVEALVPRLRAQVGWAAARNRLDEVRDHPEHDLWQVTTQGAGRVAEWRARVKAQRRFRDKVVLVLRAPLVNVEHLTNTRGQTPTRVEIAREFVRRARVAAGELRRAASRRGGQP